MLVMQSTKVTFPHIKIIDMRYHLKDLHRRGAETVEEEFNSHHSSLRNVVERVFGLLK
jgi:Skp family chaperone for outer membrane proteins